MGTVENNLIKAVTGCTLLVQNGTLKTGDPVVWVHHWKIRK